MKVRIIKKGFIGYNASDENSCLVGTDKICVDFRTRIVKVWNGVCWQELSFDDIAIVSAWKEE